MITSKKYTIDVGAGATLRLPLSGNFFKIISTLGLVDVSSEVFNLEQLQTGDGMKDKPFTFLTFKDRSGAVNTINFVISDEEFLNAPVTNTAVTSTKNPQSASFSTAAYQVTAASTQCVAGNSSRQYLMFQNRSATVTCYLRPAGVVTVGDAGNGIKIGPGQFWEFDSIISTQAWQVIGDSAMAAANLLITEG